MQDNDLIYKIGVSLLPGIGDITAKRLVAHCGGAEAIFKESKKALLKIPGFGETIVNKIKSAEVLELAEEEMKKAEDNNIQILYFLDKDYPKRLKHCEDGPVILYAKGNANFNAEKVISIVGTRKATVMGKAFCEKLVQELSAFQPLIVSGLAFGIDICAHKAALKNSLSTIGILGHGLDQIYPRQHAATAEKMMGNGGLATTFRYKSEMFPKNFADRNRIVAGLADAVVVIESSYKGGSLITADIANSYNRDVFAVPGRPDDEMAVGCNKLIKSNKAALIESAKDIKYILGWEESKKEQKKQTSMFIDLSEEESRLVALLRNEKESGIDELSLGAELPMSKTAGILLELEFKGLVKSLPGKRYQVL